MFLKIFCLLEDFFVDLVAVDGRIAVLGEEDDEIDLELGLDVVALAPVGVFGFVVYDCFYLLGEVDEFILWILEVVFMGEGLEDVVEGLLFEIDAHLAEGFLLGLESVEKLDDLIGEVIEDVADKGGLLVAFVVFGNEGLKLLAEIDTLDPVDLLEVVDGLFQQLLEQLDLGVGEFDLLDLGEVVVAEDVDLGGAVFAEFEDFFDSIALQGVGDHFAHLGIHLGAVGGFAFGQLGDDGADGEVEVDVVALGLGKGIGSAADVVGGLEALHEGHDPLLDLVRELDELRRLVQALQLLDR